MAADSKLVLPGEFQAGKKYLMDGAHLLAWVKALKADRVVPGPNLTETATPFGRIFNAQAGGGAAAESNAFWRVYQAAGNWMLQGGQVTPRSSGDSNVAAINIGTVGAEPADGTLVWLEITGDGILSAGGRLYGGFSITGVTTGSGSTITAETFPTVATPTARKCCVKLGEWQGEVFYPERSGSLNIGFCPDGGYLPTRF